MNRHGFRYQELQVLRAPCGATQRTLLEACVEGSQGLVPDGSPVRPNSVRSHFPLATNPRNPTNTSPQLTSRHLASPHLLHTPPLKPPVMLHPGRSNRQTASRGTGEGFRFCTHPHPLPSTASDALANFKNFSLTMDVFFTKARCQPSHARDEHPAGRARVPTIPAALLPHDAFHSNKGPAAPWAPLRSQSCKGPNTRTTREPGVG